METYLKVIKGCCKCTDRKGATGLYYAPVDKRGNVPYVCSECLKPISTGTYRWYYERCPDCLAGFSSPWEERCLRCHMVEHSEIFIEDGRIRSVVSDEMPPYRGWVWGADRHREGAAKARAEGKKQLDEFRRANPKPEK